MWNFTHLVLLCYCCEIWNFIVIQVLSKKLTVFHNGVNWVSILFIAIWFIDSIFSKSCDIFISHGIAKFKVNINSGCCHLRWYLWRDFKVVIQVFLQRRKYFTTAWINVMLELSSVHSSIIFLMACYYLVNSHTYSSFVSELVWKVYFVQSQQCKS